MSRHRSSLIGCLLLGGLTLAACTSNATDGHRFARSSEMMFARSVAEAGEELTGDKPTIDFALVALARTLKLERGAPLTLFALGRSIGWIGHAIEQYASDEMIRPRAKYVGPEPG